MRPVWCVAGDHLTTTVDVRPETPVTTMAKESICVTMYPLALEAAVEWPVEVTLTTPTCAPCLRLARLVEEHDPTYRLINTKRRLKAVNGQ